MEESLEEKSVLKRRSGEISVGKVRGGKVRGGKVRGGKVRA